MRQSLWLAVGLGLVLAAPVVADPPKGDFSVHDLSLWIADSAAPLANGRGSFLSAFPASVTTSRSARTEASVLRGAPLGMITFHGVPAADLDVDLRIKSGSFLGHWPPSEALPNRLRWAGGPGVALVEKLEDESNLMLVDQDHWFNKARGGDALFVRRGSRAERFLAYDAELNLPAPIRLQGGPDKFTIANVSDGVLHDVLIARKTPQGLRVAWLDELPKSAKVAPTSDKDKPGGKQPPADGAVKAKVPVGLFGSKAKPGDATKATPSAEKPVGATVPPSNDKTEPAVPLVGGVEITLPDPLPVGSPEAMAATTGALTERLARTGLAAHEIEVFRAQYAPLLFESDALVVACRLDAGAIEDKLALSIFPEPTKILRVPFVLVRNVDPQIGGEVEQLVARLGDPKYAVRESAQKRLTELGPLAFEALKKAINHTDMEVVIRAERILLNQNQQAAGRQGTGGAQGAAVAPAAPAKK
jgi:hypothetical protein